MCGIAGVVDLTGQREISRNIIRAMSKALYHRGPDEEGFFFRPGLALSSRRLSLVGLVDGQQPVHNEDKSVQAVFNGELFDYVEAREALTARGHQFITHCDTEVIPHMWEDHAEEMFEKLRGQFAIALWDERRRQLMLGRDRFGIAPLYWTRQGNWLIFASEIKGILASGMVEARIDRRGIDHIFAFSAMPGPITCFEGIHLLPPATFLRITPGASPEITERKYWVMDFPDQGDEDPGKDEKRLLDGFEETLLGAVERRLRADVPIGAYLSGGVDSSMIVALASKLRNKQLITYTVRVHEPEMDEMSAANRIAKHIGIDPPIVQDFHREDALSTYPELIRAAECPVIDTSCAALLQLASRVHANRQKAVLTGEGSDEWLIGYPWYKASKILGYADLIPGLRLSEKLRRLFLKRNKVPQFAPTHRARIEETIGGPNAWIDSYGLLGLARLRFYGEPMMRVMEANNPWAELGLDLDRAKKWHPLNRGVWIAARVLLAGHLLQAKGDRVAMNSSVEVRYPFLDEAVFDFTAKLDPAKWKLRGLRDKHLLRQLAERWVPEDVCKRGKVIFRAPLDSFHMEPEPPFVAQLLSEESLKRTGLFNIEEVRRWRKEFRGMKEGSLPRLSVEMGLVAVVATQLWHHTFLGGGLADIPSWEAPKIEAE